jgi:hypothetical protein
MLSLVKRARKALRSPRRCDAEHLIHAANLTLEEKEIVMRNELDGLSLYIICGAIPHDDYQPKYWHSFSYTNAIKHRAMKKIGQYLVAVAKRRRSEPSQPELFPEM